MPNVDVPDDERRKATTTTLDELIETLQALRVPGDTIVATEGCDCVGDLGAVRVLKNYDGHGQLAIFLERTEEG